MSKAETKLECDPMHTLHLIDRRDFVKDQQGNHILNPLTGQPQINWKCACGKTSATAADYRGGGQLFIYSDADIPRQHGK